MTVSARWDYAERFVDFVLKFENDRDLKIRYYRKDVEFFTDENDDCGGTCKWYFFEPEEGYDEDARRFFERWLKENSYHHVFKVFGLEEATEPSAPGYSFRKDDLWHYYNHVLIIVERVAMDI